MLKLMTMNINAYHDRFGAWDVRIGMIRETIEEASPDIIALQAVGRDPALFDGKDQATQLAEPFDIYPYVHYHPAMRLEGGIEEGVGVVSRFPIADLGAHALRLIPDVEDVNQRAVLHTRFDLKSGPLHLFVAHFSWVDQQAQTNVEETLRFAGGYSGPAILVGDLNQPPGSPSMETLTQAGWKDAWAELHPREDGFTFFESGSQVKRIDYAWVTPELKNRLQNIQIIAGEEYAVEARPSDHTGLLVELALEVGQ